jgi:hypothetical protein
VGAVARNLHSIDGLPALDPDHPAPSAAERSGVPDG